MKFTSPLVGSYPSSTPSIWAPTPNNYNITKTNNHVFSLRTDIFPDFEIPILPPLIYLRKFQLLLRLVYELD